MQRVVLHLPRQFNWWVFILIIVLNFHRNYTVGCSLAPHCGGASYQNAFYYIAGEK